VCVYVLIRDVRSLSFDIFLMLQSYLYGFIFNMMVSP